MSSTRKNSLSDSVRTRASKTPRRRGGGGGGGGGVKARRSFNNGGRTCSSSSSKAVAEKLEALKKLIPTQNGETVETEELFEETADYIVVLKTQVVILQRLIQIYGSTSTTSTTSDFHKLNDNLLV